MKYQLPLVVLFVLVALTSFSFAVAPTVGMPVVKTTYTTDHNYLDFPTDINAQATGADINGSSLCWYKLTTAGAYTAATFSSDTNKCGVTLASSALNNDLNISMVVQTKQKDANGTSPVAYYYRDSNAPTLTASGKDNRSSGTVTITATDKATNTGNGSGVATIYYSLNNGAWKTYSAPFQTGVGTQTVRYYAVDRLGNDSNALVGLNTMSFTVTGGGSIANTLASVLPILLVFVGFFGSMGIYSFNKMKEGEYSIMVGYAISLFIGIIVLVAFLSTLTG